MEALCRFCDPNIFRGYGFERSNRTFLLRTQKKTKLYRKRIYCFVETLVRDCPAPLIATTVNMQYLF